MLNSNAQICHYRLTHLSHFLVHCKEFGNVFCTWEDCSTNVPWDLARVHGHACRAFGALHPRVGRAFLDLLGTRILLPGVLSWGGSEFCSTSLRYSCGL